MSTPKSYRKATAASKCALGVVAGLFAAVYLLTGCSPTEPQTELPTQRPPKQAVKLVFIHHSCGENWLADSHGGLGRELAENNYFVSDTNYGWGPNGIGDRTDITDWPEWFLGPQSRESLQAVYRESGQNCEFTRTATDPGGDNQIIMFKSCFPNSNLEGNPTDHPARGEGLSVANAKAIYNELLQSFAAQPNHLFIAVTAPPLLDATYAQNAREFNRWLVQDWLDDYRGNNVAVFDFYNVLTDPENHHRLRDGEIEYTHNAGGDTLYYSTDGDDHPSPEGNRKATAEFVPLLNAYYSKWSAMTPRAVSASEPPANTATDVTTSETAVVVENQSQAGPATITADGRLIDDFEVEPPAWAAFLDAETDTHLSFARDKEIKHNGEASLQIQYNLAPNGWATCARVYDRPQDWSGSQGLCLYVHAEKLGQPITIVAYGGRSSDELLHFESELRAGQAAVDSWQRIDIPWSQLKLPEWQGDDAQTYDPGSAMGVALAFPSSADGRSTGKLWIDDLHLALKPSDEKAPPATTGQ